MRTDTNVRWKLPLAVVAMVLAAQALLIFNPGYYSHDELQWAAFAGEHPGWYFRDYLWADVRSFQYRPLTFSLWLWLSHHLFASPFVFHLVCVTLGAINAAMLARALDDAGVAARTSAVAALVFALSPFAVYTYGWVATIADLIWVGCALGITRLTQRAPGTGLVTAGSAALTCIALLSKESAVAIPALAGLAWLLGGRRRAWMWATIGAGIPVAIYLALRAGVILTTPRDAGAYAWSLSSVPLRWFEYQVFAYLPKRIEMIHLMQTEPSKGSFWFAVAVWLALLAAFARVGWRWAAAFVLLGFAALGPVLVLGQGGNHYAYGYAAVVVGLGAMAWGRADKAVRVVLVVAALASSWHGVNIMRRMHEVGRIQAVFSPALSRAVHDATQLPVRLRLASPHQDWIFQRLTHQIPRYGDVEIGDRVQIVAADAPADYVIGKDGALTPAR